MKGMLRPTSSTVTPTLAFRGPILADGEPVDTCWCAYPGTADLDGDGDLDLFSGNLSYALGGKEGPLLPALWYYENIGSRSNPKLTLSKLKYKGEGLDWDPTEDAIPQYPTAMCNARPFDFNGDGLLDLVVGDMYRVQILENVGTKTEPKFAVKMLNSAWGVKSLDTYVVTQIMDWDGDGNLDLISSPSDSPRVPRITMNNGQGKYGIFSEPKNFLPKGQEIVHPVPYGDPYNYFYLYDIESDEDYDIFWAENYGYAYLHRNLGTHKKPTYDIAGEKLMMTNGEPIKVGFPVVEAKDVESYVHMQGARASISVFDFNYDGKYDLAMTDSSGNVYYFANVGTNTKPLFEPAIKIGNAEYRSKVIAYEASNL